MPPTIPLADLKREYQAIGPEIDRAVARVLRRGWFVLGQEGEAFEAEWAAYCEVAHAVGVGNGTDALELALRAVGIGPGDEVIVPALTAAFTALAVSRTGAIPVFVDIDARRYTLDPTAFAAAINPRTAAVIPVHLYGCPADMQAILRIGRQHHLFVLEDAAQAHGARYEGRRVGGLGDAAAFSFYPSKNLGAYGDGGAIATGDAALAEKVRMRRHGGQRRTYEHEIVGINSRLDEIQAAILRTKLVHLDEWNRQRQSLAANYDAALSDNVSVTLPLRPPATEHVFHLFALRTPRRDDLQQHLAAQGIQTGVHYPRPVHLQPAYHHLGYRKGSCPNAEAAVGELLSLPLSPQLEPREQEQVIVGIRSFFNQHE